MYKQDNSIETALCLLATGGFLVFAIIMQGRWTIAACVLAAFFLIAAVGFTLQEARHRRMAMRAWKTKLQTLKGGE